MCHKHILDYCNVSIKFSYVDKIVFSLETKKFELTFKLKLARTACWDPVYITEIFGLVNRFRQINKMTFAHRSTFIFTLWPALISDSGTH